ncbi:MAG: HAMP domain-containing histidine kinase [Eubacterium sp.]|nr:HAMP domain-containing histidine kinase [Eubacterium sp.]
MKLSRTELIIQIVLSHFLVLFVGLFSIYYIECRINVRSRQMAETAADNLGNLPAGKWNELQKYAGQEEEKNRDKAADMMPAIDAGAASQDEEGDASAFLQEPDQYLTYSVFYRRAASGSSAPVRQYYEQNSLNVDLFLGEYQNYFVRQKSFYAVQGAFWPLELVSIAGHPVEKDGRFGGFVYVARSLDYAPLFLIVYALAATVVFYLVVLYLLSQKRNRDRVEQIYHQYIANISHELKTPIASIQAITEILTDGGEIDEGSRSMYYGIISRESRLLEHAVLQIIELSKLQDNRKGFEKKYVPVREVMDPIRDRFADRCEEIGVSFWIDESVYALPDLHTDPYRLIQLLTILLDNAYKFVPEEGHIFIDATTKYGQATLRVNDNGRGISEKDFPHIFERFYKTSVDNPKGTGLGLAIAQEIVNGLDESIWVQSKEGEGTIFFVTVRTAT